MDTALCRLILLSTHYVARPSVAIWVGGWGRGGEGTHPASLRLLTIYPLNRSRSHHAPLHRAHFFSLHPSLNFSPSFSLSPPL